MTKPTDKKPHPAKPEHPNHLVRGDLRAWLKDLDGWIKDGLQPRPPMTLAEAKRRRALLRATLKELA